MGSDMSSKYSEQVIEAACEAIDWAEGLVVTDALAVAVFDSLERAPWWEEVGVGYEFAPGEPWRTERQDEVSESRAGMGFTVEEWSRYGWTYFRDTRWTPPRPAYKVGDVITECTPDNLPPDDVAIVDAVGDVGQMDGKRLGWACGGGVTWGSAVGERCFPMTVIYVPKAGD